MSRDGDNEQLIDLVWECSFLYDLRYTFYKDPVKKAEAWKEIAEQLNQPCEAVKLKWKGLMDTNVKYLKSLKGFTGSAKNFKHWPWAAHLNFLKDTVTPRLTASNVLELRDPEEEPQDSPDTNDMSSVTTNPVTEVPVTNINPRMPPPQKRSKPKEAIVGDVDKVLTYLQRKTNKKAKTELDRTDYFFLSYAETFKKLSHRNRAHVKMEIAQYCLVTLSFATLVQHWCNSE